MDFLEKWLVSGIASAESVEADALSGEVHFRAHQTVGPLCVHGKDVSQKAGLAFGISPSKEDDAPLWHRLEVELPVLREGPPVRGSVDPGSGAAATGRDELRGPGLQGTARDMGKARPDFGLPTAIEVLNGRLEPGFLGGRKDGDHLQGEAKSGHTTDRVRIVVGTFDVDPENIPRTKQIDRGRILAQTEEIDRLPATPRATEEIRADATRRDSFADRRATGQGDQEQAHTGAIDGRHAPIGSIYANPFAKT